MSNQKLTRMLFEAVLVLAFGLLGFMFLSAYNMRVINQQSKVIKACGGLN